MLQDHNITVIREPLREAGARFSVWEVGEPGDNPLTEHEALERIRDIDVPMELWPEVTVRIFGQRLTTPSDGSAWKRSNSVLVVLEPPIGEGVTEDSGHHPRHTIVHEMGHVFDWFFMDDELRAEHQRIHYGYSPVLPQPECIAEDVRSVLGPEDAAPRKTNALSSSRRRKLRELFERAIHRRREEVEAVAATPPPEPALINDNPRIYEMLLEPGAQHNRSQRPLDAVGIGVHRTGNADPGADARMHWRYFNNRDDVDASYNCIADETGFYVLIPPNEQSYHGGSWANQRFISAAICENVDGDFEQSYVNLVRGIAWLMAQHDWWNPEQYVHGHFEWNPVQRAQDPIGLFDWGEFLLHVNSQRGVKTPVDPCLQLKIQLDSAQKVGEALEKQVRYWRAIAEYRERQLEQLRT